MFNFFKKQPEADLPLGAWGELKAQEHYVSLGFSIVENNFFNRTGKRVGEIDFIAKDKHKIVFVEVKTRTLGQSPYGKGAEAVDVYKQRKLLKATKLYLLKNPKFQVLQPQIDVCVIEVSIIDRAKFSVIILANAVEDNG